MECLIIDPEFRDKIPPLSADEFSKLEENILADGEVREPLVVWHNTIIDGHHRWAIIQKHDLLKYKVKQMEFTDKWAAIVWMCRNQLGRRNIAPQQRDYLIAQEYEAQKNTVTNQGGMNQYTAKEVGGRNDHQPKTREIIADVHGISETAVRRAVEFGRGLDEAEKVSPGIKDAILTGAVKAPKNLISGIRNMPEEKRAETVEAIRVGKIVNLADVRRANQAKEFRQIDDDAKRHKAFITMVYTVLKFVADDSEIETMTEAVVRSCKGNVSDDIKDLENAIEILEVIKIQLIKKGAAHGKKK